MKKVLDKDLEAKIKGMKSGEVISLFKELQDASGLKVCTAITKTDPAYKEIK